MAEHHERLVERIVLRVRPPQPRVALGVLGTEHVVIGNSCAHPSASAPWANSRIAPGSLPMSHVGKTTPNLSPFAMASILFAG